MEQKPCNKPDIPAISYDGDVKFKSGCSCIGILLWALDAITTDFISGKQRFGSKHGGELPTSVFQSLYDDVAKAIIKFEDEALDEEAKKRLAQIAEMNRIRHYEEHAH